jgi:uncharacterized protein
MSTSGVGVVRAVYEAFARGDLEGLLAHLDQRVEWRLAEGHPYSPAGETWIGHEAVVERFFARAAEDWDRFAVDVRGLHDAGEVVVAEVRYFGAFAATGRTLDAQGCHVWRLRDGKVAAFQQYTDTDRLHAVMDDADAPVARVRA